MNLYRSASLAALSVAAAVASPAWAQDARDTHFDGPYISATIGLAAQGNDRADTLVFDTNRDGSFNENVNTAAGANAFTSFCRGAAAGATPAAGCSGDRDKIEYSGRIGYDKRLGGGNFVLGGLIEVAKNNSEDYTTGYSSTPASYTVARKLDHSIAARLRAGYTPGGGALFYATGGATWSKIDHGFATTNTANSFTEVDNGKRVWGWQAGGGAEIMVTNNVSLGLEYLYNRHRDNKYYVAVGQGTAPATNPFLLNGGGTNLRPSDTDFDYHSLRASLSFQF